ncbi:unnamed protein product [Blepharisma stoltei]|uniref:Uncharacterized protein n=1 Tax=Blepharisma stoltei TaxID=1481888 RepID=A0AAU9IH43_9CILI|nr:unnamed protein product [Blepharisma stoltei]
MWKFWDRPLILITKSWGLSINFYQNLLTIFICSMGFCKFLALLINIWSTKEEIEQSNLALKHKRNPRSGIKKFLYKPYFIKSWQNQKVNCHKKFSS